MAARGGVEAAVASLRGREDGIKARLRSLGVGGDIDEGLLPRREAVETRRVPLRKHEIKVKFV